MAAAQTWWETELAGCTFEDTRLAQRLHKLIERMDGAIGGSLPFACQDWANTKAAYRFFSNERVSEAQILAGHFEATRDRFTASEGPVLVLQDTTEFTFQRERPDAVGLTCMVNSGKDRSGRTRMHTVCGLLMHSSLVVTTEGLPLGLSAIKFWSRQKFKDANGLQRKINLTRVPIEQKESVRWLDNMRHSTALLDDPDRCVHVGDRESDIYELYCAAHELGTHFVVRSCVDRLVGEGQHTIAAEMEESAVQGVHRVEIRDSRGRPAIAALELRYRRLRVLPPINKQKRYPALFLSVINAQERNAPSDRPPIEWQLITDLPVTNAEEAVEKLRWYALRWKIEVFHKILKSGCRAEDARLRTAERLTNLIAVFCILSWRVFWTTMISRSAPRADPRIALTEHEIAVLNQLIPDLKDTTGTLSTYLVKVARLGGYLGRTRDPPPGNIVIWRGLSRLSDIALGATLPVIFHGYG